MAKHVCPPNLETPDPMLKWFAFEHLPEHLHGVSRPFGEFAEWLCSVVESGPERTVSLRKLLESQDAAVRANLYAEH